MKGKAMKKMKREAVPKGQVQDEVHPK